LIKWKGKWGCHECNVVYELNDKRVKWHGKKER
jgi:hypothetical protein